MLQLSKIKQRQDAERRQLIELRDALKSSMAVYKEVRVCAIVYVVWILLSCFSFALQF